jgi:hypothetical protein
VTEPCIAPKPLPTIVTRVPTGPEFGVISAMIGTENGTALLDAPDMVTITSPLVAPLGTVTAALVSLQFVAGANSPLNVTVLLAWLVPKWLG